MRIRLLLSCLLFACLATHAQNSKPKFSSLFQVGVMDGQSGPTGSLQTINGIKIKGWSAGIGVGIDYYHTRTIPLFVDVRRNLFNSGKTPFVYINGGYNYVWLTDDQKIFNAGESRGGLYYDAGIGYSLPVLKQSTLIFSAGYSVKELTVSSGGTPMTLFSSYIGPFSITDYSLQRVSVKIGLSF